MNANKEIEQLIEKYFSGETSLEEEKQLQVFFQREDLPAELESYRQQILMAAELRKVRTELNDDDLFAKIEEASEAKEPKVVELKTNWQTWGLRVAAAITLVLVGFWVGERFSQNTEVSEIKEELALLKQQLSSNSASGRLQAVSQIKHAERPDEEMLITLFAVMKNDPNMHVRIKAVEALTKMGKQPGSVQALTGALLEENEPAAQIAIIEALVTLQEKSAIESLEKLTEQDQVLKEVRDEAYIGIFKLKDM
ncbi:HEAT repeat domain-containing protein [Roseivirga sp. UBA838]|uniref:HEAT repeat domain-containing protein n=1 Tax=Roseivirga sp. UBA838 TaxID=1947393 RepID=UPI00257BFE18|nr:HEAT repeat domain-containing protein [Roseivirga sp. UBA838]|tara:strand:+ start:59023 stop:59781 length:759 start_codon:yes stop_codon:yes gene_type:complete